jgi:membrane protease subunit HflC
MKLAAIILLLLVILAGIVGPQAFFVVDETQAAIVTRFGEPRKSDIIKPGLYFKTPFIDTVTYFDKRRKLFDAPADSLLTSDKKRLVIDVFAVARVVDPLLFFQKVRTEQGAITASIPIIASGLREEIARDEQSQIIRTNREEIMASVTKSVSPELKKFGLSVVDVRVKRIDFPEEIAPNIYERMKAERNRIAAGLRSEGEKKSLEIKADVDRLAAIIRAQAERDANIIRGCGLAEATRIFAEALEQDPEFYTFQRALTVYKTSFTQNTTMVGSAQDLGEKFEDIRQAVIKAVAPPAGATDGAGPAMTSDESEARCAELSARQLLATQLLIDRAELELVSLDPIEWPDTSLGCPEEGKFYSQEVLPGYTMVFDYQGARHEAHSNTYGSQVVTCIP